MQSRIFYPKEEHDLLIKSAKEVGVEVIYTQESGDILREATISYTSAHELYSLGRFMSINKRLNEFKSFKKRLEEFKSQKQS